jgi:hypothetical protein
MWELLFSPSLKFAEGAEILRGGGAAGFTLITRGEPSVAILRMRGESSVAILRMGVN